jgi:hypothetical protein
MSGNLSLQKAQTDRFVQAQFIAGQFEVAECLYDYFSGDDQE